MFIYVLQNLCSRQSVANILYLAGIVIFAIKIIVPILLITIGMFDLFKTMSEDKDNMKKTASLLVKKIAAAIIIFLIPSFISLVLSIIEETDEWKQCQGCLLSPFSCTYSLKEVGEETCINSGGRWKNSQCLCYGDTVLTNGECVVTVKTQ